MNTEKSSLEHALARWRQGEPGALNRLFELAYPTFLTEAKRTLSSGRFSHRLEPADLAHRCYEPLARLRRPDFPNAGAFWGWIRRSVMPRIIKDLCRHEDAARRGGKDKPTLPLPEGLG